MRVVDVLMSKVGSSASEAPGRQRAACGLTGFSLQNPPAFRSSADVVSTTSAWQASRHGARPRLSSWTAAPQRTAQLSCESLPIDVIVALDVSESVNGSVLDQLRRAVQELTRDLTPKDRLRLLTFNVRINRLIDFNAGPGAIDAAFNGIRPFGPTAVRDTIAVALATPAEPDRRQLVVVFSDGDDRSSVTTEEMLLDVVRHTTPTLGLVLTPGPLARRRPCGQGLRISRTRPAVSSRSPKQTDPRAGVPEGADGFSAQLRPVFRPGGRRAFGLAPHRVRVNGVARRSTRGRVTP